MDAAEFSGHNPRRSSLLIFEHDFTTVILLFEE
jgi:hypothetical protein